MSSGKNLLRMLLVAGLSAGTALLLAPQSGEETRRDIRRKLDELKYKGEEFAQNLADDINEAKAEVEVKNEVEEIDLNEVLAQHEKELLAQADSQAIEVQTVRTDLPVTEEEKELFDRGIY